MLILDLEEGDYMFGSRLKSLRENAGKEQYFIANKLNIARNTYTEYETSKITPPIKALCTLALFYNVSLDYILGISNSRTPYGKMKDYDEQIFIRNTKLIRQKLKYNQSFFAKLVNCHRVTLARYEIGKTSIPVDYLIKLSSLSKIPSDYIVGIIAQKWED